MKIYTYKNKKIIKEKFLYEKISLDLNKKSIVSFVGAGGKTTLIYNLAEELKSLGKKIVITTTTKMFLPEKYFINYDNLMNIANMLKENNIAILGKDLENGKISAIDNLKYKEILEACDYILIEADGSKRLPLKAPAEHEPVLNPLTTIVVGVVGIDAVGRKIKDVCHRPEIVANILKVSENILVTEEHIAKLLSSDKGQRKGLGMLREDNKYVAVINKCDNLAKIQKGAVISEVLQKDNIEVFMTSFK